MKVRSKGKGVVLVVSEGQTTLRGFLRAFSLGYKAS